MLSFHLCDTMVIQDLVETSDGDFEQVKWNILLKYFIFHLYFKRIMKEMKILYRMSPDLLLG